MDSTTLPKRFVQPDVVVSHFHIRPGDTVADLGAGSGYFLPALAAAVGPEGRLFACEIQKPLVEKLGEYIRTAGWDQVAPVWCDLEAEQGSKLAEASVDIGVLVNTLFLLEDKATALTEIDRIVRPGGKVCVIDWSESFAGLGPSPDMVITKGEVTDLFEGQGWTLETEFPAGEHHYGLAFRKS